MSFTTEELLFAAKVRDLASTLRTAEMQKNRIPPEEKQEWAKEHPLVAYVPQAMERIEAIAQKIRDIKGSP